jgi:hypothetical protein
MNNRMASCFQGDYRGTGQVPASLSGKPRFGNAAERIAKPPTNATSNNSTTTAEADGGDLCIAANGANNVNMGIHATRVRQKTRKREAGAPSDRTNVMPAERRELKALFLSNLRQQRQ